MIIKQQRWAMDRAVEELAELGLFSQYRPGLWIHDDGEIMIIPEIGLVTSVITGDQKIKRFTPKSLIKTILRGEIRTLKKHQNSLRQKSLL